MWKILVGFIAFAAIALFILTKSGGDVDMGGEKHSVETPPAAEAAKGAASVTAMPAPSSAPPAGK